MVCREAFSFGSRTGNNYSYATRGGAVAGNMPNPAGYPRALAWTTLPIVDDHVPPPPRSPILHVYYTTYTSEQASGFSACLVCLPRLSLASASRSTSRLAPPLVSLQFIVGQSCLSVSVSPPLLWMGQPRRATKCPG